MKLNKNFNIPFPISKPSAIYSYNLRQPIPYSWFLGPVLYAMHKQEN